MLQRANRGDFMRGGRRGYGAARGSDPWLSFAAPGGEQVAIRGDVLAVQAVDGGTLVTVVLTECRGHGGVVRDYTVAPPVSDVLSMIDAHERAIGEEFAQWEASLDREEMGVPIDGLWDRHAPGARRALKPGRFAQAALAVPVAFASTDEIATKDGVEYVIFEAVIPVAGMAQIFHCLAAPDGATVRDLRIGDGPSLFPPGGPLSTDALEVGGPFALRTDAPEAAAVQAFDRVTVLCTSQAARLALVVAPGVLAFDAYAG